MHRHSCDYCAEFFYCDECDNDDDQLAFCSIKHRDTYFAAEDEIYEQECYLYYRVEAN